MLSDTKVNLWNALVDLFQKKEMLKVKFANAILAYQT